MAEEFAGNAAKRRGNAGVGAGCTPLHSTTFQHLTVSFARKDGWAGERAKPQHELSSAVNNSSTSPLVFMGRGLASTSLEQLAHASATSDPLLRWTTCPGSSGGTAGVRHQQPFGHVGKRRPLRLAMAMAVAACILFSSLTVLLFRDVALPSKPRRVVNINALQPIEELRGWAQGTSVLVQHEGAVERLNLTATQRACVVGGTEYGACEPMRLSANELPSWTLHVVETDCRDCMDTYTYRTAVEGLPLHKRHAVYATPFAPLGRVGPMLLAMTSVTDDVSVRTELPQWEWLRHVYGDGFPTVGDAGEGAAPPRTPYLAVMGIPSTDQPARVALREAQRSTWLTYQEVARTENHFDAALLALYVFAAVEPKVVARDAPESSPASARDGASAAEPKRRGLSALLPTTTEYKAATEALLARATRAEGMDDAADASVVQRRMELRRDWNIAAVEDTPCAEVISRHATVGAETSALSYLSGALSLPVTPAFTSPAEYICHASSALWREALTHRNVVWIDMMTDRRPTTNKKLGDTIKWGLPVEVGMSQKLILWLEYAYHAFRDVPFIIKGDDDSYMKVPQFLSDVRYVMGGTQKRLPPPTAEALKDSAYAVDASTTECAYWGSRRSIGRVPFNAGMTFMVHRLLAQVVLAPRSGGAQADVVLLSVADFDVALSGLYRSKWMTTEDILFGVLLRAGMKRAKAVCPNHRVWFVKEGRARFHDMHRGKVHDVTWSTVVAHRCTPADYHYLHHFFQKELGATLAGSNQRGRAEKNAVAQAAEWVAEKRRSTGPAVVGWDTLPAVKWVHTVKRTPAYDMAAADGVPVYRNKYDYWVDRATAVDDGYCSLPQK